MHPSMPHKPSRRTQRGAALIVALVLLVALSVLALSSMNTATLDLIMAGNEQYRSQAFQSAEVSIEAAWNDGTAFTTAGAITVSEQAIGNNIYSYTVTPVAGGKFLTPPSGSIGKFKGLYFTIQSVGEFRTRNSTSTHIQEIVQIVQSLEGGGGGDGDGGVKDAGGSTVTNLDKIT